MKDSLELFFLNEKNILQRKNVSLILKHKNVPGGKKNVTSATKNDFLVNPNVILSILKPISVTGNLTSNCLKLPFYDFIAVFFLQF